jgi:hypothetical protein
MSETECAQHTEIKIQEKGTQGSEDHLLTLRKTPQKNRRHSREG